MFYPSGTSPSIDRKYMSLIVSFYQEYLKLKESESWGPSIVDK